MSDLSKVWATGKELAIGNQDLARPAVAGKELATTANAGLAHITDLSR
jgi:hypothetical protein